MKAIILAGGSGTRLWPQSRRNYPKQFLKLNGGKSLLQQTVKRLLKVMAPEDLIVMTNSEYKFHVMADLEDVSSAILKNIILEPYRKNTAPAIALAVKYCVEKLNCGQDEVLFVSSSDHIIEPEEKFAEYVRSAGDIAGKGYIVTFGIKPLSPETGYGYIKVSNQQSAVSSQQKELKTLHDMPAYFTVEEFTEKPDLKTAEEYVRAGNYYWNSGMFAFSVGTIIAELQEYAPEIYKSFNVSFDRVISDFKNMPDISIDYAILEKSKRVVTMPLDIHWNDIGSWDSMFDVFKKDENNNVTVGDVITVDTKETLVMAGKRLIATVGLENMLVVETDDAILIAKRGDSQKVKAVVDLLKAKGRIEAEEHRTIYRPWGEYTILEEGPRYKIKRIVVKPGAQLSLQLHYHRSEHWIVVSGTAKVIIGERDIFIHENESAYVPKSTSHRLENPGKVALELIEVQNGEYVGEDDIKRFDDVYGR